MSSLGDARAAVTVAAEACVRAMLAAESARGVAEERVTWAQNMGIDAFGAVVRQAVEELTDATQQLLAAHEAARQTDRLLAAADAERGQAAAADRITAAAAQLNGPVTTCLSTAADRVETVATLATQSQDHDVIAAVETAMAAIDGATPVVARAATAVDGLALAVRASTGNTGGAGDPSESGPSSTPPIPAAVQRLAEQVPVWSRGAPTRGYAWLDEDGEPVEFVSVRDRSARDGLRPAYAARVVTTDHVEGKLAARMRQPSGPVNVTAVINKDPCAGPIGCDATLPAIIPRDSTVSIYVRGADGVRHYRTYHGTGEGIA